MNKFCTGFVDLFGFHFASQPVTVGVAILGPDLFRTNRYCNRQNGQPLSSQNGCLIIWQESPSQILPCANCSTQTVLRRSTQSEIVCQGFPSLDLNPPKTFAILPLC